MTTIKYAHKMVPYSFSPLGKLLHESAGQGNKIFVTTPKNKAEPIIQDLGSCDYFVWGKNALH